MAHRPAPHAPPGRARGWREDAAAVSDVVGSILLVAMTVAVAAGFGILLLSFDGPADSLHVDVELRTTPGDDGDWGTGDERLQLLHLGGEPLDKDDTTLRYTADGTEHEYDGDGLGSFFDDDGDGLLTIGEAWVSPAADPLDVEQDEAVRATLLTTAADDSQLLAAGAVTGGGIQVTATSCLPDITAPSGSFTQAAPNADVDSLSVGSVTVTLTVVDLCAGVDTAVTPQFHYCVAATCTVPTSFTTVAMTDGTVGDRVWTAVVPAHVWLTQGVAGASIQYYASGLTDLAANTAQTSLRVDTVDLLVEEHYVASATATTGTVHDLDNAKAASAADGALAELREAGVLVSGGSAGPTKLYGTAATNGGTLSHTNALVANESPTELRAEFNTDGDYIEVSGFDLPANAATVTAVTIGFEGQKSSTGGTSPSLRIDYKLGSSGTYSLGTSGNGGIDVVSSTSDGDYTRALTGSFSVADVEGMVVRLLLEDDVNRNAQVDAVFATVTYTTTAQTEYRLEQVLSWTGVPSGRPLATLVLEHRVEDDTFTVEVQDTLGAWRLCSGTLGSSSLDTFRCEVESDEVTALGEVKVRIKDVTTTGTVEANLFLDHARVEVARLV